MKKNTIDERRFTWLRKKRVLIDDPIWNYFYYNTNTTFFCPLFCPTSWVTNNHLRIRVGIVNDVIETMSKIIKMNK